MERVFVIFVNEMSTGRDCLHMLGVGSTGTPQVGWELVWTAPTGDQGGKLR